MNNLDKQGDLLKMNIQLFSLKDDLQEEFDEADELEDENDDGEENHDDDSLGDDDDSDDDLDEGVEVKFTQAEVDNMFKKRLARISKKEKTFVEKQAKRYGCSEEQFMKKMEDEQARRDLEMEAKEIGVEGKDKIDAFVTKKLAEKPQGKPYATQEKEFLEAYPEVDIAKLDRSEDFLKFLRNCRKDIDLREVYENFIDLVGKAKAQAYNRQISKNARSTNAGKGGNLAPDKAYGCTKAQLALCKKNGINPKTFIKDLKAGQKMMGL